MEILLFFNKTLKAKGNFENGINISFHLMKQHDLN